MVCFIEDKNHLFGHLEERSSRESVKQLLERLVARKAEAARRSSSRSDTRVEG